MELKSEQMELKFDQQAEQTEQMKQQIHMLLAAVSQSETMNLNVNVTDVKDETDVASVAGAVEEQEEQSGLKEHHIRTSTQLPADWEKYRDDEGERYYVNNKTEESTWNAPEGSTGCT